MSDEFETALVGLLAHCKTKRLTAHTLRGQALIFRPKRSRPPRRGDFVNPVATQDVPILFLSNLKIPVDA